MFITTTNITTVIYSIFTPSFVILFEANNSVKKAAKYAESKNEIGFRIAFFVLLGSHLEQHAVFTIFGHFWPSLTKIALLTLMQFKQNFAGACVVMVSNISKILRTIHIA